MNAIADAIQPSALEALLTQTLADEAGLNDVAEGFKPILAYVASLASNQCVAETFHMFEWEKTCKAYLTPILADEEKCAAVTKKFMDESEKRVPKREVELDIPEGARAASHATRRGDGVEGAWTRVGTTRID